MIPLSQLAASMKTDAPVILAVMACLAEAGEGTLLLLVSCSGCDAEPIRRPTSEGFPDGKCARCGGEFLYEFAFEGKSP